MTRIAYLGLGSNLGDRRRHLCNAVQRLRGGGVELRRLSPLYESDPVGPVRAQPRFLNAVAEVATRLHPRALLRRCLEVEAALGRRREVPKGPRVIDIDLLLVGDLVRRWPELELPHPELCRRAFVLRPLLDLDPRLADPRDGAPLRRHLEVVAPAQPLRRRGALPVVPALAAAAG